jgi:hypothetical protein
MPLPPLGPGTQEAAPERPEDFAQGYTALDVEPSVWGVPEKEGAKMQKRCKVMQTKASGLNRGLGLCLPGLCFPSPSIPVCISFLPHEQHGRGLMLTVPLCVIKFLSQGTKI